MLKNFLPNWCGWNFVWLLKKPCLSKDWGNFCPYSACIKVALVRRFPAVGVRALLFSWTYQDLDYLSTKQAEISCLTQVCFKDKWRVTFDSWWSPVKCQCHPHDSNEKRTYWLLCLGLSIWPKENAKMLKSTEYLSHTVVSG